MLLLRKLAEPLIRPPLNAWWRRHPSLSNDIEQFRGFSATIRDAMLKAAQTHFFRYAEHQTIGGWLSYRERQMLYALGRWLPGPIVEIGPWLGLSTTAIARGIKHSRQMKPFHTFDLRLTTDMFRPMDGGIGMFLPGDDKPHGVSSVEAYNRDIFPILSSPGGPERVLRGNIERCGLSRIVQIHYKDFRDAEPIVSGFVFCDAVHDLNEIANNAPGLLRFLRPTSVLACHDIGHKPELSEALRRLIAISHAVTIDSLYIAEIASYTAKITRP